MWIPWAITGVALLAIVVIAWLAFKKPVKAEDSPQLLMMQEQLGHLRTEMQGQVSQLNQVINEHLQKNLNVMQESQSQVGTRLDNAAKVIGEVQNRLGKMESATDRIYEVGKDIASLQDILKAPKLRGSLGELFLSDLLSQVLPSEHYSMQHRFKSGEVVDAIVKLADHIVPIDSKFPLENFKKMTAAEDDAVKKTAKRLFVADVKKHVEAIATKYIRPDEGTFDFALMYIPAENVYYETIIKDDDLDGDKALSAYALSRRVIPVSPNNFYAYLNTILLGLKGFKVEESIKDIMASLTRLKLDFNNFVQDFNKIGTHLNHARSSYENSDKRLSRFQDKLTALDVPDTQPARLDETKSRQGKNPPKLKEVIS